VKFSGGLDPRKTPTIKYCRRHELFINLLPSMVCYDAPNMGFRVVCSDCGAFGPWRKHPVKAIEA